ncbi:hypothetical protein K1719_037865 [Acacia pycnantha]|nr:hypothetical protein K1719_037865 [Acacia pycnantha]
MNAGTQSIGGDGNVRWRSVSFTHPSTLDTIAMEIDMKNKVKSDLESFLIAKQYYQRLGRVWKRSFLFEEHTKNIERERDFEISLEISPKTVSEYKDFMSSRFESAVIGAPLKLSVLSDSLLFLFSVCSIIRCMLFCSSRKSLNLVNPTASIPLRSKRTCSGVECFRGFHNIRFSHLFIFLRGDLTVCIFDVYENRF